ncbi:MAG: MotA/TolQ/ExbB proton channel family protein [Bacteroidota bacterium]
MRILTSRIILWLFNDQRTRNKGRIPLGFHPKAIWFSAILALIVGVVAGNIFLHACFFQSNRSIKQLKINFPTTVKTTSDKLGVLLHHFKQQVNRTGTSQDSELNRLLTSDYIEFESAVNFISSINKSGYSKKQIIGHIHGRPKGFPFTILYKQKIPALLRGYGLTQPDPNANKLGKDALNYRLAWALMSEFRQKHKNLSGLNVPYWFLTAFAGHLQWVIFFVAICCFILLQMKKAWADMQRQLILHGTFPGFPNENLWNIDNVKDDEFPFFTRLSRQYNGLLLPVLMIQKVLKTSREKDKPLFEAFLEEEIALLKEKSYDSYALINTQYESCPAFGFIGTIIGATLAFGHASGVLNAADPQAMEEEMNVLTGDLSLSFFTTLTGLIAALLLSFMISKVKTQEAELFILLEQKCTRELKRFWKDKKKYSS